MKKKISRILTIVLATVLLCMPLAAHAEEPEVQPGPPALIVVARDINICTVYDKDGNLIRMMPCSTGREGHRTPLGTYSIYAHVDNGGYHAMVDGTYGKWCMRWKSGGYMFHSVCYAYNGAPEPIAQEVADIGTSVSRGCVRLQVTDAEWLYNNTANGCAVLITEVGNQVPPQ